MIKFYLETSRNKEHHPRRLLSLGPMPNPYLKYYLGWDYLGGHEVYYMVVPPGYMTDDTQKYYNDGLGSEIVETDVTLHYIETSLFHLGRATYLPSEESTPDLRMYTARVTTELLLKAREFL